MIEQNKKPIHKYALVGSLLTSTIMCHIHTQQEYDSQAAAQT